ncbi:MAG: hypothetical protein AABX54_01635 [Nanoarchaeota archaeon]
MEIQTKIRKIGHSVGIVTAIPKEFVEKNNLKLGNIITVNINVKTQPNIWGLLKGKKGKSGMTTEQLLEEADKGWED